MAPPILTYAPTSANVPMDFPEERGGPYVFARLQIPPRTISRVSQRPLAAPGPFRKPLAQISTNLAFNGTPSYVPPAFTPPLLQPYQIPTRFSGLSEQGGDGPPATPRQECERIKELPHLTSPPLAMRRLATPSTLIEHLEATIAARATC